jgi:hypothetical protein
MIAKKKSFFKRLEHTKNMGNEMGFRNKVNTTLDQIECL